MARRRKKKSDAADAILASVGLIFVAVALYPKVLYYISIAAIAAVVLTVAALLIRHHNRSAIASRNTTTIVSGPQGTNKTEQGPSCGIKMTLRTNSKDESQFWGCLNCPHCKVTFRRPSVV
ncbi:MAG: hypothetical protein A3G24_12275 [Betaproteobacteria bacterium RIFCSPLOWO2_12_FULL_62_13]|nr:MAG: hypothetical protein A3G24_12275 [Betaproteobacteria bacterium RIFCSPLOWO2_12_FULL_62_13]